MRCAVKSTSPSDERSAGNLHATFCGSQERVTAPGDPVRWDNVPDPPENSTVPLSKSRHRLDDFCLVQANPIFAGLHHEHSLARA
jgi:hypothetical protein